ncbi:hypothetical protein GCM10012275_06430 [Longimycelium tulufanense]|uniref:Uncharacterized protein n=1 Tax=Longimycelium tulufanense TaxID=907463 RepID=A0A8J3FUT4_9PSEU|nr:hypothetical protein [Longimycelium tulufanense]GGM38103.1 hypothetical protein GCM10012275_06430 [Longimycelium tulufanense]
MPHDARPTGCLLRRILNCEEPCACTDDSTDILIDPAHIPPVGEDTDPHPLLTFITPRAAEALANMCDLHPEHLRSDAADLLVGAYLSHLILLGNTIHEAVARQDTARTTYGGYEVHVRIKPRPL